MALARQAPPVGRRYSVIERVRAALPRLSPAERRVADALLTDPGAVVVCTISEFAQRCGVAQPTLSRFSKSIGCASYPDLRLAVAHDLAFDSEVDGTDADDDPSVLTRRIVRVDKHLPEAARMLRRASSVEIWASREFAAAGDWLAAQLRGLSILAASSSVPSHWTVAAHGLSPASVLVLLSHDESPAGLRQRLRASRDSGASAIAITTHPTAGMDEDAQVLVIPSADPIEACGFAAVDELRAAVVAVTEPCIPAGSADPWRAWPDVEEMFIPTDGDPIPALLLRQPGGGASVPTVLFLSGFTAPKEEGLPPGGQSNRVSPAMVASILNGDYNVLLADHPGHGARKRAWEQPVDLLRAGLRGDGPDLLLQAETEARFITDELIARRIVEPGRLGVVGQSWGGLGALLKMAGDDRIACCVAIMPVCDVAQLDGGRLRPVRRTVRRGLNPGVAQAIAPRPVLLVAGADDSIASPEPIAAFVAALRSHYVKTPDNLDYHELDGVGHELDARQLELMSGWLAQNLPVGSVDSASGR